MDKRNTPSKTPWPEDFDVALKARQKALENKPQAPLVAGTPCPRG